MNFNKQSNSDPAVCAALFVLISLLTTRWGQCALLTPEHHNYPDLEWKPRPDGPSEEGAFCSAVKRPTYCSFTVLQEKRQVVQQASFSLCSSPYFHPLPPPPTPRLPLPLLSIWPLTSGFESRPSWFLSEWRAFISQWPRYLSGFILRRGVCRLFTYWCSFLYSDTSQSSFSSASPTTIPN